MTESQYEVVIDGGARLYRATDPTAALVWVHGGGFVAGDIDMPEAHWVATALSESGVSVLSVDYRLAGASTHYPIPLDDVAEAWRWAGENASRLGVSAARLSLGGASAGANLAAGTVIRLLGQTARQTPASLMLVYPTLHLRQPPPDTELRALLDRDPSADIFGPDALRNMYTSYLAELSAKPPAEAIPALASRSQLAGFPRTLVVNAQTDELRISGDLFAGSLRDAAVEVTTRTVEGTIHGFLNTPQVPAAQRTITEISSWLATTG